MVIRKSRNTPAYIWEEFTEACRNGDVLLFRGKLILNEAQELNLFTKKEILTFLTQAPDEIDLQFKDSKPLREDLFCSKGAPVDAYYFGLFEDTWYLAILKTVQGKWVLKSFKRSEILIGDGSKGSFHKGNQIAEAMRKAKRKDNK